MAERNDATINSGSHASALPAAGPEQLSVAGVYDYYLGGVTNTAGDRRFGDKVLTTFPLVRAIARANRAFLQRVVRHLMRLGVRQFIDIGSGLPTMGNTHIAAEEFAPGTATVIYVDNEPGTVAQARHVLEQAGDPARHAVIHADLRDPDPLWRKVDGTGLVDLSEPIGLLIIAVLHIQQLDDKGTDAAIRAVARYRELLPTGSYLVISHATTENVPDKIKTSLSGTGQLYVTQLGPVLGRSHEEIAKLFGDFELIPPGITWTPLWHPEETTSAAPSITFATPNESAVLAGVGRKA